MKRKPDITTVIIITLLSVAVVCAVIISTKFIQYKDLSPKEVDTFSSIATNFMSDSYNVETKYVKACYLDTYDIHDNLPNTVKPKKDWEVDVQLETESGDYTVTMNYITKEVTYTTYDVVYNSSKILDKYDALLSVNDHMIIASYSYYLLENISDERVINTVTSVDDAGIWSIEVYYKYGSNLDKVAVTRIYYNTLDNTCISSNTDYNVD